MKFAFALTLLLGSAEASTISFPDEMDLNTCKTHSDCPKFFNEEMVCSEVVESYTERRYQQNDKGMWKKVPTKNVMTVNYNFCVLHAFCGAADPWDLGSICDTKTEVTIKCMPDAPAMPANTLVTADHVKTMVQMMKI